ncbi:hypothetical protein EHQ53_14190 [Leptospira langatensis]|uniref:HEPN domain-containing protein n=1 Tax=Leptospira langatensis TaxID=2484983 RepID=A0ABY2MD32_9LEPT|nr:hypothetical protein [Leptospira langatensis]TGL39668.1 hypothetical protein EHQ53_14190 [Leptospira langatensis]
MIEPVHKPGTKEWRDYMQKHKDRKYFTHGRDEHFRKEEIKITFEQALEIAAKNYEMIESIGR